MGKSRTLSTIRLCAEVELLNVGSEVLSRALTDDRGDFKLPNVPKGQYTIRVRSGGYGSVAQQFMVTRSNRSTRCNKPTSAPPPWLGLQFGQQVITSQRHSRTGLRV